MDRMRKRFGRNPENPVHPV